MKILVIGRKTLFSPEDPAEEWDIAEALRELGNEVVFLDPGSELLPGQHIFDWILIAKTITREEGIWELEKLCPGAKIAYWQPDYGLIEEAEGGFMKMASHLDLYIGRMTEPQSWFTQNNIEYIYWNFDVACNVFQKESGKSIQWAQPQTPFPDVVPISFAGNWVHNPFRANILRDFQYEFRENLHIVTSSIPEFEKRDDLRNVHHPAYGHRFNYLVDITKINLSIESNNKPGFWGPRTARIMAAGGFALVWYKDGMEKVFGEDGQNVSYFSTVAEGINKARYFLRVESARQEIADRGYEFALKNLRPINRVKELNENLYLRRGSRQNH